MVVLVEEMVREDSTTTIDLREDTITMIETMMSDLRLER